MPSLTPSNNFSILPAAVFLVFSFALPNQENGRAQHEDDSAAKMASLLSLPAKCSHLIRHLCLTNSSPDHHISIWPSISISTVSSMEYWLLLSPEHVDALYTALRPTNAAWNSKISLLHLLANWLTCFLSNPFAHQRLLLTWTWLQIQGIGSTATILRSDLQVAFTFCVLSPRSKSYWKKKIVILCQENDARRTLQSSHTVILYTLYALHLAPESYNTWLCLTSGGTGYCRTEVVFRLHTSR